MDLIFQGKAFFSEGLSKLGGIYKVRGSAVQSMQDR